MVTCICALSTGEVTPLLAYSTDRHSTVAAGYASFLTREYGIAADNHGLNSGAAIARGDNLTRGNAHARTELSANTLKRFEHDVLPRSPQATHVCILIGTNDLGYRVPTAEIAGNIDAMAKLARERGVSVLVCTVPALGPRLNTAAYTRIRLELNAAIARLHDITVVDLYTASLGPDGAMHADYGHVDQRHFNTFGYALIARLVAQALLGAEWTPPPPRPVLVGCCGMPGVRALTFGVSCALERARVNVASYGDAAAVEQCVRALGAGCTHVLLVVDWSNADARWHVLNSALTVLAHGATVLLASALPSGARDANALAQGDTWLAKLEADFRGTRFLRDGPTADDDAHVQRLTEQVRAALHGA